MEVLASKNTNLQPGAVNLFFALYLNRNRPVKNNAAVQHENVLHSSYSLAWKITKLNRSAGAEQAWLTGAGQQAAGKSVAMVKKTVDGLRSADVAVLHRCFHDILRTFLCKGKDVLQWVIRSQFLQFTHCLELWRKWNSLWLRPYIGMGHCYCLLLHTHTHTRAPNT